nr:hypothetical protein Dp_00005 [Serratia proteamaculans]
MGLIHFSQNDRAPGITAGGLRHHAEQAGQGIVINTVIAGQIIGTGKHTDFGVAKVFGPERCVIIRRNLLGQYLVQHRGNVRFNGQQGSTVHQLRDVRITAECLQHRVPQQNGLAGRLIHPVVRCHPGLTITRQQLHHSAVIQIFMAADTAEQQLTGETKRGDFLIHIVLTQGQLCQVGPAGVQPVLRGGRMQVFRLTVQLGQIRRRGEHGSHRVGAGETVSAGAKPVIIAAAAGSLPYSQANGIRQLGIRPGQNTGFGELVFFLLLLCLTVQIADLSP